jgi:hypothetical protein
MSKLNQLPVDERRFDASVSAHPEQAARTFGGLPHPGGRGDMDRQIEGKSGHNSRNDKMRT